MVRTRFAPAASNHLSLRDLHTGLLNWLLARSKGGTFAVRIGDLDLVRGRTETIHRILDDVRWLDVDWDEGPDVAGENGPYLQSESRKAYEEALDRLRVSSDVYEDEILDPAPRCTRPPSDERPVVLRYRLAGAGIGGRSGEGGPSAGNRSRDAGRFRDFVRGEVPLDSVEVEDPVVQRPDGSPSPMLARVVDDARMRITHVLRPDDEYPLTVAESALYDALGVKMPRVGHFPSLIGADGKPYSRRHGAFNVDSFKKLGYLPRTLANYLVSLSWSRRGLGPKFDPRSLGDRFHVAGIRKVARPFQFPELNRLSTEYLSEENLDHLVDRVLPYLIEGRFVDEEYDRERLRRILETVRPRIHCLSEIVKYVDIFFGETVIEPRGREVLKEETATRVLRQFRECLQGARTLDARGFEEVVERLRRETGLQSEQVELPIRAALTGITQGEDLEQIASILGPQACIGKVDRVLAEAGGR